MEIKFNTKDYTETQDVYELARGVFHHFDHENIRIKYETTFDEGGDNVTISWSSEPSYRDYLKLEQLNNLLTRFTTIDYLVDNKDEEK